MPRLMNLTMALDVSAFFLPPNEAAGAPGSKEGKEGERDSRDLRMSVRVRVMR